MRHTAYGTGFEHRHKKMGRSQTHRHRHLARRRTKPERKEEKPVVHIPKVYDPDSWRGKLPMFPGTGIFIIII